MELSKITTHPALANGVTKKGIAAIASEITEQVNQGNMRPMQAYAQAHVFEQIAKEIKAQVKEAATDEASEPSTIAGMEYACKEAGTRYDYSNTPEWVELNDRKKELEAKLRALKDPENFVNPETGEYVERHPPVKTSSTTITIKIAKQ